MSKQPYNWQRYWSPRSESITLDWDGYLPDPTSDWGRTCNPKLVTLSEVAELPCLVLLGEAGMGKTTALESAHQKTYEQTKSLEDVCLPLFRLGDYGSDTELCNAIFRNPEFQEWLSGEHKLYLFLDSLDEGLLSIKILARILKREIENLPCDRLYFRITCRATEWALGLEEKLKEKWGKYNVEIYTLTPLAKANVVEAAVQKGVVSTDHFLKEVSKRNAIPLAIKPITLKLLIGLYIKEEKLPTSQVELYERGCLQLCKEINSDRLEAGWKGKYSETKRRMIAGRIAAVMVFSNRSSIWMGSEYEATSDSSILPQDLCVGQEKVEDQEFDLEQDCIEEVFEITGLFSVKDHGQRIEFSHRTYVDFLAAWHLKQRHPQLQQILQLIIHDGDPDGRVVPQLHETVAWLSSMLPEVFQRVMQTDPDVLLRSDIQSTTDVERKYLVDNLLRLYDEQKLANDVLNNYQDYKKFNHQDLSEQLKPYICDSTKGLHSRHVAIDIAKASEQRSLQDELVKIVLDFSEPSIIRSNAASAICRLGDARVKENLKNLALVDSGDDPNDEIKGYALRAVYPDHISVYQLFDAITPPKAQFSGGAYQQFISNEIVDHLQSTDLLVALEWLERKLLQELKYPFQQLADAILFKAWENLNNPDILEKFSRLAIEKWRNYKTLFSHRNNSSFEDALIQDDAKRHKLLEAIVSIIPFLSEKPSWILGSRTGVILQKDILWMLKCVEHSETQQEARSWASLIRRAFRYPEQMPQETIVILEVSQKSAALYDEFSFWLKTIDLNSAQAVKIYIAYLEEQAWQKQDQDYSFVEPSPRQRVLNCLDSIETGNIDTWWDLNLQLTLLPTSEYYDEICRQLDIKKLPGWKNTDASTRVRIVEAAELFLRKWQSKSIGLDLHEIDVAAYKAIQLLLSESFNCLSYLPDKSWKQFARIFLLVYSYTSDSRDVEDHHRLMKVAYQHAPQEAINTLMDLIDEDNKKYNDLHILGAFQECWDQASLSVLSEKLLDQALSPESFGRLLEVLLDQEFGQAQEIARSSIPQSLPSEFRERSRAISAAAALILHTRDAGWSTIWPAIQQDPNFGREIFKKISYSVKWDGNLELKLREEHVADIFIFLAKEFPQAETKKQNQASRKGDGIDSGEINTEHYRIGEEDSINIWKGYIPQRLQARGTIEACNALRKIINELPSLTDNLQWRLLEAEDLTRRATWKPQKPRDILQLIFEQDKRLVQNGNQLIDVLIESLRRLELELQGETPAAVFLWNENKPKDENDFSNYVKLFLDRDLKSRGIIINREVELRRSYGGKAGERTDIHVDAVLKQPNGDAYDSITAIIEVKGCWHNEVKTAIKTQLVERYLADNPYPYGLYLIGWFNCQQWDSADSRKSKAPKMSLDKARAYFNSQAEELTSSRCKVRAYVLDTALR